MSTYRRIETISHIRTSDTVRVIGETVERTEPSVHDARTYDVRWVNVETGADLPESSAIYHFLETEFHKLPEED